MLRQSLFRAFSTIKTIEPEVCSNANVGKVSGLITEKLNDRFEKLFAVVYVNGRQFKVAQNDLITLEHNQPLKVGDKIKLEKVMVVGSKDFTILGRPLLDSTKVSVAATVVEKNVSSPEAHYTKYDGKGVKHLKWLSKEQNILRINSINVDPSIVE